MKLRSGYLQNQDSYCAIKVTFSCSLLENYMREEKLPPDLFDRITKEDEQSYAVDLAPGLAESLVRLLNWYLCGDMLDDEEDMEEDNLDGETLDGDGYHELRWSAARLRAFLRLNAAHVDAEATGQISYLISDHLEGTDFWQLLTYGDRHGSLIWGPVEFNDREHWRIFQRENANTVFARRDERTGHLDKKALWKDSYGEEWDAPAPTRGVILPEDV